MRGLEARQQLAEAEEAVCHRSFLGEAQWKRVGLEIEEFQRRAYSLGVSDVTRILDAAQKGDPKAAEELLPLVYDELRKLAAAKMAQEHPGHTLQTTALVHEAWLRLTGSPDQEWNGRGHFFAAAAEAMRRILVENARRKRRLKHGGDWQRIHLTTLDVAKARNYFSCGVAAAPGDFTPVLHIRHAGRVSH